MKALSTSILLLVVLTGCSVNHSKFYNQVAPSKYPTTRSVKVFEYRNVDLDQIYELLFSDFLVIGKSAFNGPYESPINSVPYAKSIGADVFISTSQFTETRTSLMFVSVPTVKTTYISGYTGSGPYYATATSFGTQTSRVPIHTDRFDQNGIFLKNINGIHPLWERTKSDYEVTGTHQLSGKWRNESYELEIVQSGNQLAGFVVGVLKGDKSWSHGELKLLFGTESNTGIYLMGNKTPMPAWIETNKFGHLEVKLVGRSDVFSFERIE